MLTSPSFVLMLHAKGKDLKTVMPERLSLGSRKLSSDLVLSAPSLLIQPYLCLPCPPLFFKVKERKWKLFSSVLPFVTPRTVACQAPPSLEFSGQKYWSCYVRQSFLHGIFLSQGSNPVLLHCRQIFYCLGHQGASLTLLHASTS